MPAATGWRSRAGQRNQRTVCRPSPTRSGRRAPDDSSTPMSCETEPSAASISPNFSGSCPSVFPSSSPAGSPARTTCGPSATPAPRASSSDGRYSTAAWTLATPGAQRPANRWAARDLASGSQTLEQRRADQDVRRRDVRRQRHVSHVADPQQRLDVRIVRVLVQWVNQEDDRIHLALNHPARNLHVTPVWTRSDALALASHLVPKQVAGGAGGDEFVLSEACAVERRKCDEISFFSVVGDDRQPWAVAVRRQLYAGQHTGPVLGKHRTVATKM